jgi:hypothetical protein
MKRPIQGLDGDVMQQGGNRALRSLRAASCTRSRCGTRASRLCVRTLALAGEFPSG